MFNSVSGASHSFKLLDVEHLPNPLDIGVLTLDLIGQSGNAQVAGSAPPRVGLCWFGCGLWWCQYVLRTVPWQTSLSRQYIVGAP